MNTENNKQIGRKEMLDTYVRYVRHRGDARVILKQRLNAILSAFNPGMNRNVLNYSYSGILIDENCNDVKIREIEDITGKRFEDNTSPFGEDDLVRMRQEMFEALLMYRVNLDSISHTYDGVFECSRAFMNGICHTRAVNEEIMNLVNDKIDRVIFLLLGDKYEKTFTVGELREKYGYPNISDSKLSDAIINDLPD
jgi:hypothetical protein